MKDMCHKMYTDTMRQAVHSIIAPKNFGISIIDNDSFLTIKLNEKDFTNMFHDQKIEAVQYVAKVKDALEQNGAIVLVTREATK
jgi:predicted acetyltransferase